ncbi:MAG TPA: PLD nuclease N-terminal domain-containing protein [Streptosporangiaceae bacterium]
MVQDRTGCWEKCSEPHFGHNRKTAARPAMVPAERVRFLPRWAWAVACLIVIPLGGVLYLLVGRVWTHGTGRSAA